MDSLSIVVEGVKYWSSDACALLALMIYIALCVSALVFVRLFDALEESRKLSRAKRSKKTEESPTPEEKQ